VKKTWIIIRHEFTTTIRRISYILLTISFPLLGLLGILIFVGVTQWGGEGPPPEDLRVGYVDETSMFDEYTNPDGAVFILYGTNDEARDALFEEEVDAYFVIPENYIETGLIWRYTTKRELPQATMALMEDFLIANLLAEEVSEEILARVQTPTLPISTRLDPETGEIIPPESEIATFAMPYVFALLFMMSLFFTSGYLLQGVSEEKENRLIEILLSSVSARQLLSGKVIGPMLAARPLRTSSGSRQATDDTRHARVRQGIWVEPTRAALAVLAAPAARRSEVPRDGQVAP